MSGSKNRLCTDSKSLIRHCIDEPWHLAKINSKLKNVFSFKRCISPRNKNKRVLVWVAFLKPIESHPYRKTSIGTKVRSGVWDCTMNQNIIEAAEKQNVWHRHPLKVFKRSWIFRKYTSRISSNYHLTCLLFVGSTSGFVSTKHSRK